jgi:hypothetical protein
MKLRALILPALALAITADLTSLRVSAQRAPQPLAPPPAQKQPVPPAGQRLLLTPKYVPGQVIRYQMENTTMTESHRGGAVRDPQGSGSLRLNWSAIVRMEVLSSGKDAQGRPSGSVRIRSKYEKSAATSSSGTYDPEAEDMANHFRSLEGKSFEFTLDAAGRISDVKGFEGMEGKAGADAVRQWMAQLSAGASAPSGGIVVGQAWSSEQPIPTAPLAGLVWRSHSTYLRNEPCQPANPAGAAGASAGETCAVILTKLELANTRPGRDTTPEDYRKRGLRTAGTWAGSGDSLSYVSLRTGHLVSVTQSSKEQMDFNVSTVQGEDRLNYQGSVESHSHLALLPSTKQ